MLSDKRPQRGMSLIELLVVMVILVIGIFAIARVFPQGFRFITHARNVTLAGRLNQAEIERWKAFADNVPDGIEAESAADGSVWTDYNPNDMSNANSSDPRQGPPAGATGANANWFWSNVNRVRLIRGETTTIPVATTLQYSNNAAYSIYNLKFAPVVFSPSGAEPWRKLPGDSAWPDQYVLIYGDPSPRSDVSDLSGDDLTNALQNLDISTYGVNYNTGTLYFHQSYWDRKYRVEFSWWYKNHLYNGVSIITVPAASVSWPTPLPEDPVPINLKVPDPTVANGGDVAVDNIDAYSDRVARKFMYVQPGGFDTRNPYQFTLLNNYNQLSFSPTIGFNPAGNNRTVRTDLGTRALTAHIDYEVVDWHIIHEERTIPDPTPKNNNGYDVSLTLPGIKVARHSYPSLNAMYAPPGTTVQDMQYTGITPDLRGYSVVALDLTDNTLMIDDGQPGSLKVDYRTGTVHFPSKAHKYTPFGDSVDEYIEGHDFRIFYQAVGDWAVQATKAWSNYQRRDMGPGNFQNLQYDNFDVEIVKGGPSAGHPDFLGKPDTWYAILTFPKSNAGQSVAVSFLWNDTNGGVHTVTGQHYELPEYVTGTTSPYPYVAIPFAKGNEFAMPTADNLWKNPYFTFVQGATLKVRTIWREDPRRWEVRDMETFINRK